MHWLALLIPAAAAAAVMMAMPAGPSPVWDERVMYPVVQGIVATEWSWESLLYYQDTKGPVFFWLYAAAAELLGPEILTLRLLTAMFFVFSTWTAVAIASAAGVRGVRLAAVCALFVLLPYHLMLGVVFMSEASFVFLSLLMCAQATAGIRAGRSATTAERFGSAAVYGVLLSLLLHHRVQASAWGGAICLVAAGALGVRSLPWWIATAAAGLSRVPLMIAWGGIVSPAYQERYGLGFRLDGPTYLLMAGLPVTCLMLFARERDVRRERSRRRFMLLGAAVGLLLGIFCGADILEGITANRYLGITATALRPLSGTGVVGLPALSLLATLGGAALAATAWPALAHMAWRSRSASALLEGMGAWAMLLCIALYSMTRGDVYDRYLMVFAVLQPMVWVLRVPALWRWAAGAVLAGMAGYGLLG